MKLSLVILLILISGFALAQQEKMSLPAPVCDGSSKMPSDWTLLGPLKVSSHCMGRINAIAALASEPDIIYAGGAFGGGIFRTKNASSVNPSWQCITDPARFKTGLIGDILIDPSANSSGVHDIYFVCELGVFKSTDDGATWLLSLPLEHDDKDRRLYMDPDNHLVIYMLERTEVHKTSDGGKNWQSLGFNKFLTNPEELHWIACNPLQTKIIYVSGNGNHLYRYDPSASAPWLDCTNVLTSIDSMPAGTSASFRLTAAGKNLYIMCKNAAKPSRVQIYHSSDGGFHWSAQNVSETGLLGSTFIVSAKQQNVMYLGDGYPGYSNRRILKSIDGGQHFFFVSNYYPTDLYNGVSTHGDIRALKLIESSTTNGTGDDDFVIAGDDGGVLYAHSSSAKKAAYTDKNQPIINWTDITGTGLAVAQFHGIGGREDDPSFVAGGTQDDGVFIYDDGKWSNSWGCDAYETVFDVNSAGKEKAVVYSQKDCGGGISMWQSVDGGQNYKAIAIPAGVATGGKKPMQLIKSQKQLYIAYHDLYKSSTPDLHLTADSNRVTDFTKIYSVPASWQSTAFEVCEKNPLVIYYGFGGSMGDAAIGKKFFRSDDGGKTWSDLTNSGNDETSLSGVRSFGITSLAMNPDNPDEVYVAFDGFTSPENVRYRVMRSLDGGKTWKDFSEGLAGYPVHCMKYQQDAHTLYIGTWIGVFARKTNESSSQWECFNKHLPATAIYDLEINYCAQKIRAGTFGRGLWESDLAVNDEFRRVKTNATWKQNVDVFTDLVIEKNVTLTVTGKINMAKGKKIIVKRGAQLILDGGMITNACGLIWKGIELWGVEKKKPSPKDYGRFVSKNGGKIGLSEAAILKVKER
jgi:photosystem II stability/assembly factor-like uncharacterized protein